jgi:hypothetical protein
MDTFNLNILLGHVRALLRGVEHQYSDTVRDLRLEVDCTIEDLRSQVR